MLNALVPNTSLGTQINDLLGKYGMPGGFIGAQVDSLAGNPLSALKNLQDAFIEAAIGRGTTGAERSWLTGGSLPPFGGCLPPHVAIDHNRPRCGHTYFQRKDLAPGAADGPFAQLFDPRRRAAATFERALNTNPLLRNVFERAMNGHYVPDGRCDGKITLERNRPSLLRPLPGCFHPLANTAAGMLQNMDRGIGDQLKKLLGAGNPFQNLLAAGLGQIANGAQGAHGCAPSQGSQTGATQGSGEANGAGEINRILADKSLTFEDKIMLVLLEVTKAMDDDIKAQMKKIEELQANKSKQQPGNQAGGQVGAPQGGKGGKGGGKGGMLSSVGGIAGSVFGGPVGGMVGGAAGNLLGGLLGGNGQANAASAGATSGAAAGGKDDDYEKKIDVETTKLKRLTDKRSQMFDTLRQILDTYNKTAKGMIDAMAR